MTTIQETALRALWTERGIPRARQDALLAEIIGKAAPGAMVGPFSIQRPAAAMPGHALALSFRQQRQDRQDAHRMAVLMRLRGNVNARARLLLLSGLAGGMNVAEVAP